MITKARIDDAVDELLRGVYTAESAAREAVRVSAILEEVCRQRRDDRQEAEREKFGDHHTVSLDWILDAWGDSEPGGEFYLRLGKAEDDAFGPRTRGTWTAAPGRVFDYAARDEALEAGLQPYLAELTIDQLDAVRKKHWEQAPEQDAADELGIARTPFRLRLCRAYARLKALLEAKFETTGYRRVRERLTTRGASALHWSTARCVYCGTPLAQYAGALGNETPALSCPDCRRRYR